MSTEFSLFCDSAYSQRLLQLKEYMQTMFLNIERNGILKELQGSPELDCIRVRKIEEIVSEALRGEKERQVQIMSERNDELQNEILKLRASSESIGERHSREVELEKACQEYKARLQQQQKRHEKEADLMENHFRELMRSALSNYQRHLTKERHNYQEDRGSNNQIEQLRNKVVSLQRHLEDKDKIIEELTIRLEQLQSKWSESEELSEQLVALKQENTYLLKDIALKAEKIQHLETGELFTPERQFQLQYLTTSCSEGYEHTLAKPDNMPNHKLRYVTRFEKANQRSNPRHKETHPPKMLTQEDNFCQIQKDFEKQLRLLKKSMNRNTANLRFFAGKAN